MPFSFKKLVKVAMVTLSHLRFAFALQNEDTTSTCEIFQACNIALGKPTSQLSTRKDHKGYDGTSDLAVDGNRDGDWFKDSATHTNHESNPWWRVNLQAQYSIKTIKVFNRQDGAAGEKLKDFNLAIYNN
eukprot:7836469-Ditylum_brightwellii.AAC.1